MGHDQHGQRIVPTCTLSTTPLYVQLRDLVIQRIQSFVYEPGTPLPNEFELASEFKVSIGTVRKAMDNLSSRGLVVRQQGRGTFVASAHEALHASLLTQVRREDGSPIKWDPPRTVVALAPADQHELKRFGWLAASAPVLRFEWLSGTQGRCVVLQKTSLPNELVDIDIKHAKHISSLDELLSRARLLVNHTEVAVSVASAGPEVATRLKVASGTCLQRLQRRFVDLRGKPIAISDDWLSLRTEVYTHTQHRGPS